VLISYIGEEKALPQQILHHEGKVHFDKVPKYKSLLLTPVETKGREVLLVSS
jgi:hypothetical protein